MNLIYKISLNILNTLFPEKCAGCQKVGTLLCEKCLEAIPPAPPAEFPFMHAVFDYRYPPLKNALWRFKYKNSRGFAKIFAQPIYEKIVEELRENIEVGRNDKYIVAPIPLHPSRRRERGYNQSDLLAKELLACDTSEIFEYAPKLLIRTRKTKSQARAEKRQERIANLRGAFLCTNNTPVRGRTVIFIDDVTTTGATLLAAKKALADAHPYKVLAFTVAH